MFLYMVAGLLLTMSFERLSAILFVNLVFLFIVYHQGD